MKKSYSLLRILKAVMLIVFVSQILFLFVKFGMDILTVADNIADGNGSGFVVTDISIIPKIWKPVSFSPISEKMEAFGIMNQNVRIRVNYKSFQEWFKPSVMIFWIVSYLSIFAWLFVTIQMRKILNSLPDNVLFNENNMRRIKWIGIVLLLLPIINALGHYLITSHLSSNLGLEGYKLKSGFSFQYSLLLPGFLIVMMAEIFRVGTVLQQEKDLTI